MPPLKYLLLILAWCLYLLWRSHWHFESLINIFTTVSAFILFYWIWKSTINTQIIFAVFAGLGSILSIWGLVEYADLMSKTYSPFTMTGPFNNPAGITASLALLYPFCLYFSYKIKDVIKGLSILASLLMAAAVILSGARAAILAITLTTVIFILHLLKKNARINFSFLHYAVLGITCVLLLGGMYFIKKDSADGRLLIWHCSGQLIKQAPLFGYGNNGFTSCYMTEQANYFTLHPESRFTMLADNTSHPFNEYIKEMVEYGIIGFSLSIILIATPLYKTRKKRFFEIFTVRLSLFSVALYALFSYPLHYPFVRLMVVLLLAYLVAKQKGLVLTSFRINFFSKTVIGIISVFLLFITFSQVRVERKWKQTANNSLSGFTEEMLPQYRELYSDTYLKKNALFLYNYAAELNISGNYSSSNTVLLECCKYMNDMEVQMLLADNFEKTEDYISAEQALTLASRMVPVRFFPLYKLAKMYEKNNEYEKTCKMAEKIIRKEVKIPSMKITVMKNEMEEIITKHQINAGKVNGAYHPTSGM